VRPLEVAHRGLHARVVADLRVLESCLQLLDALKLRVGFGLHLLGQVTVRRRRGRLTWLVLGGRDA
jgi:hypothetical protein